MMPPPWSRLPCLGLKAMETSRSLYLPSSQMQTLNTEPGFFEVCDSTSGPPGASLSSSSFHTLPSALPPVTPEVQPLGSLPRSSLLNPMVRAFSSAASGDRLTSPTIAITQSQRILQPL